MRLKTKRKFLWAALIGFFFWLLGSFLFHFQLYSDLEQGGITDFEKAFQKKAEELTTEVENFAESYPYNGSEDVKFAHAEKCEAETGFVFLSFNADTLDLWSSNRITIPNPSDSYWEQHEIVLLENGWYKLVTLRDRERLFVGAFLVKNEFKYENDDLVNQFSPELATNLKGDISFDNSGFVVHNAKGDEIFSVVPTEEIEKNETLEVIIFFCYLLGFAILFQLLIVLLCY